VTTAYDIQELRVRMKVPQNAKSFTYDFNFFSAEYPEFVCTRFNDRFIALLSSGALAPASMPPGSCRSDPGTPQCNVSFDANGQPVTINNGFFDICKSNGGNTCSQSPSLLAKTGYDRNDFASYDGFSDGPVGGATGWLTTTAPVNPGEEITLRFIILDEGDASYDSAVLIDNFAWQGKAVTAPVTIPVIN
jgi:hypothetical protein